jgi:hypothetical protein
MAPLCKRGPSKYAHSQASLPVRRFSEGNEAQVFGKFCYAVKSGCEGGRLLSYFFHRELARDLLKMAVIFVSLMAMWSYDILRYKSVFLSSMNDAAINGTPGRPVNDNDPRISVQINTGTDDIANAMPVWKNRWSRTLVLGLGLAVFSCRMAVAESGAIAFDIPAQPLDEALGVFGEVTGFEIIANARQVHGLRSSRVKGVMTPYAALELLLAGTGVEISDYSPGNIRLVLAPESFAPAMPDPAFSPDAPYFAGVQRAVLQAMCSAGTTPGSDRLAMKLWVEPSGAIARVKLLDSTGDASLDAALGVMLGQMDVGEPPADLQQPITLVVQPSSSAAAFSCETAGGDTRNKPN